MLKKLFKARFGGDKASPAGRELATVADLQVGDLVTFKHRLALPPSVQGQTFEVARIGAYEYEDGLYPQLALEGTEAGRIYLGFKDGDASELCLSRDAPRQDLLRLFDEQAFGALWDEDFAEIAVAEALADYDGWLGERYAQTRKSAEGYFHDKDCRGVQLSEYQDDDADELRVHECEDPSGRFGLTVEVWGDGGTDVSLDVHCSGDVVESMWPGEGA